ncbi:hypothetical protein BGZ72_008326 [Mortierella alpina]|nr:hypothetical protein BGZ72_008326 [Mortierella alpina]
MEETHSFHMAKTMDTMELVLTHVGGQTILSWEDIEHAFPGAKRVHDGKSVIKFQRSSSHQNPPLVLEVVLITSVEPTRVNRAKLDATNGDENPRTNAPVDVPVEDRVLDALEIARPTTATLFQQLATRASRKVRESEVEQRFISLLAPEIQETVRASSDIYQAFGKAISHGHGDLSRVELSAELNGPFFQKMEAMFTAKNRELQDAMNAKHEELQAIVTNNEAVIIAKQDEIKRLQERALENQRDMKQMQKKTLEQLAVLQSRVQAILTQTYELHEYPIPRLFVVLPQDPSVWDTMNPFANKFKLYFLCECGEHTKSISSKTGIPHHIHLAKHEGYEIAQPSKFFEQYGSYVLTILKMLKYTVTVSGIIMPAFSQLISPDVLGQSIIGLKLLQDTIVPGVNQVIGMMDNVSADHTEDSAGLTGQVNNKEALEGADLRKLETFLKDKDGNKVLGNLYRTVTDEGHVKWVCMDHYRENYNSTAIEVFRRAVVSLRGSFDENDGLVAVRLRSRESANQFYLALGNSRSVHELDIILEWDCSGTDLQALEDALRKSAISILHLDVQKFQPSLSSKLSSQPARYEAVYRILHAPNVKSIHIVLPRRLAKLPNFVPQKPPHLRKLSFEMTIGNGRVYGEVFETGLSSTLYSQLDWRVSRRARAQFEASSSLTKLSLSGEPIGPYLAQALFEALKTNSTLTTLHFYSSSIGTEGAQALSEVLKTNSTLTDLNVRTDSIGPSGAQALSEALKTNSTLITLNLFDNLIGASGAQALSEALMTNSTLISLALGSNSIGLEGGQALSEGLKSNSTLTELYLRSNAIGTRGAQALSEALKTNSTLTMLAVSDNSIGVDGTQALSEALKINSTLTTLDLSANSIGSSGARALSEALKTNSTLTTLDLRNNSIGDRGAQALCKALETNSTLTALEFDSNKVGDSTAKVLLDALTSNRTR